MKLYCLYNLTLKILQYFSINIYVIKLACRSNFSFLLKECIG